MTDLVRLHPESSGLRSHLSGLWLPLITPFCDGVVDEVSLRRLVRHYVAQPIDGLILAATSGEGLTLGMTELEWIAAVTRETIGEGRRYLPICLGLSGSHTRKLCHTLDETAGWPIDGYLISSPYYSRPSQRGLIRHFTVLADHASWPIVLYNIPYRTGVNLENETLLELASHPNIVGLKDCGANRAQSIDLLRRRPPGFRVLTGEDTEYFDALTDGADGAILLSAHIETAAFAAVCTLLKEGQTEAARERWESLSDLTRLLFAEPSPAPAKYWLSRTGLIESPEVRLPMVEVRAELAARLDTEIARRGGGHVPDSAISSTIRSRPQIRWVRWVRWLVTWPNRLVAHWPRRETIQTLQALNDHQLRDIGIRRDQIETAANGITNPDVVRSWGWGTTYGKRHLSR
jgi:4-hydroxy-tetrahydrodipicolinate synthase